MNSLTKRGSEASLKLFTLACLTIGLVACGGSNNNTPSASSSSQHSSSTPSAETVQADFIVQSFGGALLAGAPVMIDDVIEQSDDSGRATFALNADESYVVQAQAEGYVMQALPFTSDHDGVQTLRLTPVKHDIAVTDIEAARTLSGLDLNTRITFPANAFVTEDGEPATGTANLQITPWNINSDELTAMPGNGQAVDAMGDATELISAGMITVDIYNTNGDYLQLADGVTAELQMDLPFDSINGEALSVGSTIPLWHFDESQGLWVEDAERVGEVIESATSPTGLAVYAEVDHFSTWNWDFKFESGGSIHVECRLPDNDSVPCAVIAEVTLDDGSALTKSTQLPIGGATIINMPTSATINWTATSGSGLIGDVQSDLSADVVIELGNPVTENFVQCLLPDDSSTPCEVTMTDGSHTLTQHIPAQGATVITGWSDVDPQTATLSWSAETPTPVSYNQQQVLAEGNATSSVNGSVSIAMAVTPIESVYVQCFAPSGGSLPCMVDVNSALPSGTVFSESHTFPTEGGTLLIPSEAVLIEWTATADGNHSHNGQFFALSTEVQTGLLPAVNLILDTAVPQGPAAQSINVVCVNGSASASSCDITLGREGYVVGFVELEDIEDSPIGQVHTLTFPNGMGETEWVLINAMGDDNSYANGSAPYSDFADGETIELELSL